jgi:hypothetical protein
MTFRAPVVMSPPRPQPPSYRRRLMAAAVSPMSPFTLRRAGRARQQRSRACAHAALARVGSHAPVAAAIAEEREVLHVLARRHGGDALERKVHGGYLLKHLRLPRARAEARRSGAAVSPDPAACAAHTSLRRGQPRAAAQLRGQAGAPRAARAGGRASFSGGISRFASQSHAPLPSDTEPPVPVPALAGVMPSSLASPIAARR